MSSPLTLRPGAPESLPGDADYALDRGRILASARQLVASLSPTLPEAPWHRGKVYSHKDVDVATETFSTASPQHPPPGAGDCEGFRWHARRSTHRSDKVSYDHFRQGLLVDHTPNEREYVESCTQVEQLEILREGEFEDVNPFPAAKRDFVFSILTVDNPTRPSSADPSRPLRSFIVISIPMTHPKAPEKEDYVRGRYVSVEEVREEEGGRIVWTMAVSSDAGGRIPRFISERVMPQKISEDVPSFLKWVQKSAPAS
ncbi:hypothetical protein Rhopal_000284-T1 [Rhodotorula paludigena]|uniref:DUF3074 domain-containing protein n=1 Tax=Rhodotorula paludigena TaxID=86838 RepID=A0AAV5G4T4_9BASI|nr:hypothetical protein Rhopal_000284-T1 [Rhodotorula paludigena]